MRKIVDGVRYDTSTAREVGSYVSPEFATDFRFWGATLYRAPRSGRYFIHGRGGPMTRFAQASGQNSWTGGEDIIPLTPAEAREWAETYLGPEIVEQHFGDSIEDA